MTLMLKLFLGNWISAANTLIVLGMFFFITRSYIKRNHINKWGRRTALFILIGTGISGLSAVRDAYAMADAMFSMTSMQSNICSIAGGAIFLTGIVSIFLKNQVHRKRCFFLISALFTVQVLTIELSRIVLLIQSAL